MEVEDVFIEGIHYQYGLECGSNGDMCVWQMAPDNSSSKRKQICSKHYGEILDAVPENLIQDNS